MHHLQLSISLNKLYSIPIFGILSHFIKIKNARLTFSGVESCLFKSAKIL